MSTPRSRRAELLVPLAERMRYLHAFRVAAVAAVITGWFALPAQRGMALSETLLTSAGYLALSALTGYVWRRGGERNLSLIGATLLVDGAYLAVAAYIGGGVTSPVRYTVLLHLLIVSLLASYRTGLKLALWHSLLLFLAYNRESADVLHVAPSPLTGHAATVDIVVFGAMIWLVSLTTATFAAVNERELRRRTYDLAALARLAEQLETSADALAVGNTLIDSVMDELGFERAVVVHLHGTPQLLSHRGAQSAPPPPDGLLDALIRRSAEQHAPCLLSRLSPNTDPWLSALLPDARNLVAVALHVDREPVAVLVGAFDRRVNDRVERRVIGMVERFVSHAALALGKVHLVVALERLANTDSLTELATRRSFDAALARAVESAAGSGAPLTLVMLDIDHFKQINDVHGHQVGDEVLRAVARVLRRWTAVGVVARYGGEEFAVLLPGQPTETAAEVAEGLRLAVRDVETVVPVTVSVGVATFPAAGRETTALVRAADEALYAAKAAGRDRVMVARGPRAAASAAGLSAAG